MSKDVKRYVGIRHRVKVTTEGEARPTEVVIIDDTGVLIRHELKEEIDEFDFLYGRFPTSFRAVTAEDDLTAFLPHHIVWRTMRDGESQDSYNPQHVRPDGKKMEIAVRVPEAFDGLHAGDSVAMILGGSGDYFAYALARKGIEIGATVSRIPPFSLKSARGENDKNEDAQLLAVLYRNQPGLFFPVADRDMALIFLSIMSRERKQVQRDRIACSNRVNRLAIGVTFCSPIGMYPEGGFKNAIDSVKANSSTLSALVADEKRMNTELLAAVEKVEVYDKVLKPLDGMGPAIASPIISGIGDIRRFKTAAQLKAYCGVHVLPDGRFPRRRAGSIANWSGELRQALYLFGDQCVKRKDSVWGLYYRRMKANLREKHPEVVVIDGKKRYTDGHIHKMAIWRTLTRFVEWLHQRWWELEGKANKGPKVLATALENAVANDTTPAPELPSEDQLRRAAD